MPGLDHLGLLEREVEAMTSALASADPEDAVPACPGWVVRDLASHVTGVHTWVTATLDSEGPAPFVDQRLEGGAQELAAAYHRAGSVLLARLRELPPERPCWTFDANNRTTGFWRRRQVHEISVHRWDLAPYALDEQVAADGIDEILDFLLDRQVASGRVTLPEGSLQLLSPDRTWTVGEGQPVAAAEGTAGDLLLSLWGRKELLPTAWRDAKLMP